MGTSITSDSSGGVVVEFEVTTAETTDVAAEQVLQGLQDSNTTITVQTSNFTATADTSALSAPLAITTTVTTTTSTTTTTPYRVSVASSISFASIDIGSMPVGSTARTEFVLDFTTNLAAKLEGIEASDITITSITSDSSGGVVVEFEVTTAETTDAAAEQVLQGLKDSNTTITVQ